jgi:outer membrane protein TolC
LLSAASVVWDLRAKARAALCAAEIAQAREINAKNELALRDDLAARLDKQAAAGVISRYETARSQLERIAALRRLNQAHADLSTARHDLAATVAMPIAQIQSRSLGTSCLDLAASNPAPAIDVISDEAIGARLEVRAKLAEFRAADAAWRTEVARRTPDLALGPGYTYDQGDHKITFTASGEIPLSNRNEGAIARAAAERDRVAAELDAVQIDVLQSVSRAIDGLRNAEAAQASVGQLVAESEALVHREVERQAAGETDEPTVIAAKLVALGARDEALTAARGVVDALAALESAAQAPLAEPMFDSAAALARFNDSDSRETQK